MYQIKYTNRFKKDVKLCYKRGMDLILLEKAIDLLASTGKLPSTYKPHALTGQYKGKMECHLQPDWLMVWEQNDKDLVLLFTNTGTHSDLF